MQTQHTSWQSIGKQRDERREEVGVCGAGGGGKEECTLCSTDEKQGG